MQINYNEVLEIPLTFASRVNEQFAEKLIKKLYEMLEFIPIRSQNWLHKDEKNSIFIIPNQIERRQIPDIFFPIKLCAFERDDDISSTSDNKWGEFMDFPTCSLRYKIKRVCCPKHDSRIYCVRLLNSSPDRKCIRIIIAIGTSTTQWSVLTFQNKYFFVDIPGDVKISLPVRYPENFNDLSVLAMEYIKWCFNLHLNQALVLTLSPDNLPWKMKGINMLMSKGKIITGEVVNITNLSTEQIDLTKQPVVPLEKDYIIMNDTKVLKWEVNKFNRLPNVEDITFSSLRNNTINTIEEKDIPGISLRTSDACLNGVYNHTNWVYKEYRMLSLMTHMLHDQLYYEYNQYASHNKRMHILHGNTTDMITSEDLMKQKIVSYEEKFGWTIPVYFDIFKKLQITIEDADVKDDFKLLIMQVMVNSPPGGIVFPVLNKKLAYIGDAILTHAWAFRCFEAKKSQGDYQSGRNLITSNAWLGQLWDLFMSSSGVNKAMSLPITSSNTMGTYTKATAMEAFLGSVGVQFGPAIAQRVANKCIETMEKNINIV